LEKTKNGLFIFFTPRERAMHIVLFSSVLIAILSGIPLKYYEYNFAKFIFNAMGNYTFLKFIHNSTGVLIISLVFFHLASLAYLWIKSEKFFRLIDMKLTWDDLTAIKNIFLHLFLLKGKPEFGRYTFFQKIDYFVSSICLIILAITGFILMFPVASTSFISISWLPISIQLHSSISALFTVFILISHIFNTHLHPEKLYFNTVWIYGTLTEEKMKLMHSLEYKKMLKKEADIKENIIKKAEEIEKESKVKKEKKMLEDYLKEGNALAQSGEYAQAVERYKEAIEIYPNYSQARFNLGVAYKKNKQYKEAITAFKEFVDMDPFNEMVTSANSNIEKLTKLVKESEKESKDIDG
jgi:cytochrome b subunit of formate dehydrogenase